MIKLTQIDDELAEPHEVTKREIWLPLDAIFKIYRQETSFHGKTQIYLYNPEYYIDDYHLVVEETPEQIRDLILRWEWEKRNADFTPRT